MNSRFLSTLIFSLSFAVVCIGQDAPVAEPPASDAPVADTAADTAGDEEKDEHTQAVEELLDVMKMEETSARTIDQMLAMQVQQQPQLAAYKDLMEKFLRKHLAYKAIKPQLVQLYRSEFTKEDLNAMSEFYKTPAGQKAINKLPMLAAAGAQIGMRRVQQNMGELQKAIATRQAELDAENKPGLKLEKQ